MGIPDVDRKCLLTVSPPVNGHGVAGQSLTCGHEPGKGHDMSGEETGKSSREPGRPQKPVDLDGGPLAFLAQELRNLREACGNPTYGTLEKYACIPRERLVEAAARGERLPSWSVADGYARVPRQRLAEAASGKQLPSWLVVEGYARGCWAYYQNYQNRRKDQPPLADIGDLARWQQLHHDAGTSVTAENQRRSTGDKQVLTPSPTGPSAKGESASARLGQARIRRAPFPGRRSNRRGLAAAAGVTGAALLSGWIILGTSAGSGRLSPGPGSTTAAAPESSGTGIFVVPAARACGRPASDGFRSPATTTFSSIKTIYTVSLESLAASVMQGTYNGISFDWVEAHPTGSRAAMQLRWSNARGKWYYCTATLEAGKISSLPDLVTTMAVPATIDGRRVTYQACVWHQQPYTAQCSPTGI